MRIALSSVSAVVCLLASAVVNTAERMPAPQGAIVRLYNMADASPGELRASRTEATHILRTAGVQIAWRDCSHAPLPPLDACAGLLAPMEFLVRLVRVPETTALRNTPLGFSYIDAGTRGGSLATVHMDRVGAAAGRAGLHAGIVLGRVIAHELGHLLLGTTTHARTGIMRPHFSDTWLAERADVRSWRFSAAESLALRRTLAARIDDAAVDVARLDTAPPNPRKGEAAP